MQADPADRITKTLTALVSVAYFGLMAFVPLVLVGAPAVKVLAGSNPQWSWALKVPAAMVDSEATVVTSWGPARLEVEDVQGKLRLPIGMLPWWLFSILWTHAASGMALILLSLQQLRRILQRVRDGAPFDADNARRLQWLGLSLFGLALLNGVVEFVTSLAVRRGLSASSITVPVAMPIDGSLVFVAFVLVVLARIFRRGADLEHDQSLVV
jgi:hypothetical protein